jgi:hypothetical protein
MLALALSAAIALVSNGGAAPARADTVTRGANFPVTGLVVPGQTIGGIALGMTQLQVKQLWGSNYTACTSCGPNLTWIYEYPGGNAALGAAVKFTTPSTSATTTTTTTTTTTATSATSAAAAKLLALQAAAATAAATAKTAAAKAVAAQASAAQATATAKAAAAKAAAAKAAKSANAAAAQVAALKAAAAAKVAAAKAAAAKTEAAKAAAAAKVAAASAQAAKLAAAKAAAAAKVAAANALAAATAGTVVAVFTLGSPVGWGVKGQVIMFDPVSNVYNLFGNPGNANCIGYSALTVRVGDSTTSFYSSAGVIYGFALTAPSQSPCQ